MTGMFVRRGPYLHTYDMRSVAYWGALGRVAPAGDATGRGQPKLRSNFVAKRRWTVGADSVSKGLTVGVPSWAGCLWEPLALARWLEMIRREEEACYGVEDESEPTPAE